MKKISLILLAYTVFVACKKRQAKNSEQDLYEEVSTTSGYTYYQNGDILSAAGSSPHGSFKLRFNSTAKSVLDTANELPIGSSFPDGSIIVKEVYSGSSLTLYAIMKKNESSKFAGSKWEWVEYDSNGKTKYSLTKKGEGCVGCHSTSANRDLTLTFGLH